MTGIVYRPSGLYRTGHSNFVCGRAVAACILQCRLQEPIRTEQSRSIGIVLLCFSHFCHFSGGGR